MRAQMSLAAGVAGCVAAAFVGGGRDVGAVALAVVSGVLTVFGGAIALDENRKDRNDAGR
jgi:hypothetical protein